MRFTSNGPAIPDELLIARDEGRVVFFCGAGVSRAKAGMPDFFGLVDAVIQELDSLGNSDARAVLDEALKHRDKPKFSGLISADRIFGLLERQYDEKYIQASVARNLKPKLDVDLSAHEIVLRLAKTPDSRTQIVTTNFDRLFELCNPDLATFKPPRLPDVARNERLSGIVYLHGRVTGDYNGADGDGFVLSTSGFGDAYLSRGWATEFFREVIRKYVVVFIGYTADDPPMHYMLEGFRRFAESSQLIYAFQSDGSEELTARWLHKGVEPIVYADRDNHRALWETLAQWAIRADAPQLWQQKTIEKAIAGPSKLLPFERGQIAHIVSTAEGAANFAEQTPNAEWLCVFDSLCRGVNRDTRQDLFVEEDQVDGCNSFAIDSDAFPKHVDTTDQFAQKQRPLNLWDAFETNDEDRIELNDWNFSTFRGRLAITFPALPQRIEHLSNWIARVSNSPVVVWWAAGQDSLHPRVRSKIEWNVSRRNSEFTQPVRDAWRYLSKAWRQRYLDEHGADWYDLNDLIDRHGWSNDVLEQFTTLIAPQLQVSRRYINPNSTIAPLKIKRWDDLIEIKIKCAKILEEIPVPDGWLATVICELRRAIEHYVNLAEEIGDFNRFHISPLNADNTSGSAAYGRSEGISSFILYFSLLFDRLAKLDVPKARREFETWEKNDETIFARLRIWGAGFEELVSAESFACIIEELDVKAFWSDDHQRDLLLTLRKRWSGVKEDHRRTIESRLLRGPEMAEGEGLERFREYRAWAIVNRLEWLALNGCQFTFDIQAEIAKHSAIIPNWKSENAKRAADSRDCRGGFVSKITDPSELLKEPDESLIQKSRELSKRDTNDFLKEYAPFDGLCEKAPERAFKAILIATQSSNFPIHEWNKFLSAHSREEDEPSFSAKIADTLTGLPSEELSKILYEATWWFQKRWKSLLPTYRASFDKTTERFIQILVEHPTEGRSAILNSNQGRDWMIEAINSPVGRVAMTAIESMPELENKADRSAVDKNLGWLSQLLNLESDSRRYATVLVARNISWFFALSPEWTNENVLRLLDEQDEADERAFWGGLLAQPGIRDPILFQRLKPWLLRLVKSKESFNHSYLQSVAHLVLRGWIWSVEGHRLISTLELRQAILLGGDDFRSQVLWQVQGAISSEHEKVRVDWKLWSQEFLQDAWPKEKVIKTPSMSTRLCELLLANSDAFIDLFPLIVPHLTKLSGSVGLRLHFDEADNKIIKNNPGELLHLLYTVLPDRVADWPYNTWETLDRISCSNPDLDLDVRMQELRRRWRQR